MRKSALALMLLALLLLGACSRNSGNTQASASQAPSEQNETIRPDFALPDLDGKIHKIGQWDGDVVLLNFWAPWCPPCRKEIPDLARLQETYANQGLVVIGVALDTLDNTRSFVDTSDINYPVLIGDNKGLAITKAYGNTLGALPFSVVIDRNGDIRLTHRTAMTYQEAEQAIRPYL